MAWGLWGVATPKQAPMHSFWRFIVWHTVVFTNTVLPLKWKWSDVRPSMMSHTRNLCSAFNPSKCTHTAVNTHTPWTHTRSSGQPMLQHPGSSWGFGALLRVSLQSWYWRRRECWLFTPPTDNSCRTWDSNPRPLGYKSDSLSIRPRLPQVIK